MAGATGLEPATSGVTGRRSNQLSYAPGTPAIVGAEWFGQIRPAPWKVKVDSSFCSAPSQNRHKNRAFLEFRVAKTCENRICHGLFPRFPNCSKGAPMAKATQPTVTLKHLAATLAADHEMAKKQSEAILNDLVSMMVKHLKKGDRIRIGGFGILQVRKRAARMGRNPATGEPIKIKASKKVAFRAAKELKEAV
jgi:DNA-binding protein HU-beta